MFFLFLKVKDRVVGVILVLDLVLGIVPHIDGVATRADDHVAVILAAVCIVVRYELVCLIMYILF